MIRYVKMFLYTSCHVVQVYVHVNGSPWSCSVHNMRSVSGNPDPEIFVERTLNARLTTRRMDIF